MEEREQIALFVDLDNFAGFCLDLGLPIDISSGIKKLTQDYGRVVVRRSFGDIYKLPLPRENKEDIRIMLQNNLIRHEDVRHLTRFKNSADIRLVVEALTVAATNPQISTFAVVADDRDFVPLFNRLREMGKTVIGIGGSQDTSASFYTSACDRFYYHATLASADGYKPTRDLGRVETSVEVTSQDEPLYEEMLRLLLEAIRVFEGQGKEPLGSRVALKIKELKSDFDYREYGFTSFKSMCERVARRGLIDMELKEGGDFIIQCNSEKVEAALQEGVANLGDERGIAGVYLDFVEDKLKAELLSAEQRQAVYERLGTVLDEYPGVELAHLAMMLVDEGEDSRAVYKLLYGLYRGRSFLCGFSSDAYNPNVRALQCDASELDERFITNTLRVYQREKRHLPFDAKAWSEVFFGNESHADKITEWFYDN